MNALQSWLGQKTTIAGLATILGTISAALTGQMTWQAAIPVMIGAVVAAVMPETPAAPKQ
jgi:hypothetical protein